MLSKTNPVRALPSYYFMINFKIILPTTPGYHHTYFNKMSMSCLVLWWYLSKVKMVHTYAEIKRPTRWNRWFFTAKLTVRSTCFGHHYAHHQELKSIIQVVAGWYLVLWFTGCWFGVSGLRDAALLPQTGHITYSSTPDQQPANQSTKYHRQQPPV